MSEKLAALTDLAVRAGARLSRAYRSGDFQTRFKDDHSLVTQADLEADQFITGELKRLFPEDSFLSEELSPAYPAGAGGSASALWVIDPLDGTTNFSLGLQFWGVSIARLVDGLPELAVLSFPLLGELYSAQRGAGAQLNGNPLRIQPETRHKLTFFTCCSRTFRRYQVEIPYKTRILGSAAYTFCAVARSVSILGFEATPKIWDLAAAWLIVEEAGGSICALAEPGPFPVRAGVDYAARSFPTLAASSRERLEWALKRITPKERPPATDTH